MPRRRRERAAGDGLLPECPRRQLDLTTYGDLGSPEAPGDDASKIMRSAPSTADGDTVMTWDAPDRVAFTPGNDVALVLGGDDAKLRGHVDELSSGGTVTLAPERQP